MIPALRMEIEALGNLCLTNVIFDLRYRIKINNLSMTRLIMKSMAMGLQNLCLSWVWQASVGAFQDYAAFLI